MRPSFNKNNQKENKQNKKAKRKTKVLIENKPVSNPIARHSSPVKNQPAEGGQIISGYFLNEKPYKEMIIQRVNGFLYGVLVILVVFCFVSYYFVSCKEVQLNQISRQTLELNYENEELQNKVDSLQSYYNIDKAVSKTNILERAKNVVEVNAINLPNLNFNNGSNKTNHSLVVGY